MIEREQAGCSVKPSFVQWEHGQLVTMVGRMLCGGFFVVVCFSSLNNFNKKDQGDLVGRKRLICLIGIGLDSGFWK